MDLNFLYYSIITIFAILNPVSVLAIIRSLLDEYSKDERRHIISKAIFIGCVTLILFTFAGNLIFNSLGIELYSFRVAGGLLLSLISLDMIFSQKKKSKSSEEEVYEWENMDDLAVTPLAIPLITGPGTITTSILLYNSATSIEHKLFVFIAIIIAFSAAYLIFKSSDKLFKILGTTGTKVITRLMGLILLALSVQYVADGLQTFIGIL